MNRDGETLTMPPKKKHAGGRPRNIDPKQSLASLKGSKAYREWLEQLAAFAHLPVAILIEHSLREYAENHSFKEPQPKR